MSAVQDGPGSFYVLGGDLYDSGSVDAIYRFDADTYEFVELDQRLTLNGHGVPGLMVPRDSLGVSFV